MALLRILLKLGNKNFTGGYIKMTLQQASKTPIRPVALIGALVAGVVALIVALIIFPNLGGHALYLTMAVLTIFGPLGAVGLYFSGLYKQVPQAGKLVYGAGLGVVLVLDVIFFVLPLWTSGGTANDRAVTFAGNMPAKTEAVMTTAPADAMNKPADAMAKPTADAMNKPADAMAKPTADAMSKPADAMAKPTADAMSKPADAMAKTGPVSGSFSGRGAGHEVSGTALLGKTADGKNILRFENFKSTNGPDLVVYLVNESDPSKITGGLELGKLKATEGNLNYELDPSLDLSRYKSVVIYCKAFSVFFGVASLS
jgi:hypothetical protein